jgi:hypothetical protein
MQEFSVSVTMSKYRQSWKPLTGKTNKGFNQAYFYQNRAKTGQKWVETG